jgi:hypothetical protein
MALVQEPLEAKLASEKAAYDAAASSTPAAAAVELSMRVLVKDGDELIADSAGGGFLATCAAFEAYVAKRFPRA